MSSNLTSITVRFEKAAEALKLHESEVPILKVALSKVGIECDESGLMYLDSRVITQEDLVEIISGTFSSKGKFCIKAAAMYLKGENPFEAPPVVKQPEVSESGNASTNVLIEYLQANKPIGQMTDAELLAQWEKTRDETMEQELNRRAKGQAFIVLKPGKHTPGKEEIDIPQSLELLKNARKRVNPTIIPYENNTFATVYKIGELNINDRIIETCPICGEILWKGYCPSCEVNLASVGEDERAYVKLVVDSGKVNVKSAGDRKALVVSAGLGLDDLKVTWPGIFKQFEELKATGNLPKLRRIADRPAKMQTQDPFHVAGNRQY